MKLPLQPMSDLCYGRLKCFILLLGVCLTSLNSVLAQELQFRHLSIDQGLSQNLISDICQDHKGFMWFGTKDGLNRYDGYNFKIYKVDTFDSGTIPDNYITAIYEDEYANLWIGTMYGGLLLYDRVHDSFVKINDKNFPKEAKYISTITGTAKTGLIVTFLTGYVVFVNAITTTKITGATVFSNNFHIVQKEEELQVPLKAILTPDGLVWISGKKGFKIYDPIKKVQINPFKSYPTYVQEYTRFVPTDRHRDDRLSPLVTSVQDLQWDDEGIFWMNSDDGLYEFSPERKQFVLHRFSSSLYSLLPIRTSTGEKQILVNSYNDKLLRFVPATGEVKKLDLNNQNNKELADVRFSVMKTSRDGCIWLGSNGRGIFFSHPYMSLFETGQLGYATDEKLVSSSLYTILQRKSLKTGNEQVLYSTLQSFGQLEVSPSGKTTSFNAKTLRTRCIAEDGEGAIWIGCPDGLMKYNPEDHTAQMKVILKNSIIMSIYPDKAGIIWFTTFSMLYSFNPVNNTLKKFPFLSENYDKMGAIHYSTIQPDSDGSLWIGTAVGLWHFSTKEEKYGKIFKSDPNVRESLSSNDVKSIYPDPRQSENFLWVGTSTGLNRLDKSKGTFKHFTTTEGLANNTVYGIIDDEKGNLWLSTNQGLSMFNTKTNSFINFDVDNGLQSNEFNTGAYYKNREGEFFFGGINGYNRFYPQNITTRQQAIPVVISEVELVGAGKELKTSFSEITNNVLQHDHNTISITLASLDYMAPEKIVYAYRIVNQDTSWINIGRNRIIQLTNLSPGTYVFQGRGTDGLGRWNDKIVEMTLVISPPWWRTNLAYFFYVTLFLSAIYGFWRRYRSQQVLAQNIENERRQAQAILELDRIKSRFLANITHEFRTPLTLINGHLEQLNQESSSTAVEVRYKEMEQNSHQLLELINQLMDLSKIESGAYLLRYKTKDLVQEVKTIVLNFSHYSSQKGIQLTFEIAPSSFEYLVAEKVTYDEGVIRTVLTNLLSNACKFTPRNGNIEVELAYEQQLNEILITVSNSGERIPEEELNRLFDRFYQADNTAGKQYGGSGIGLSLVKELVVLHGGSVSVESKRGNGSQFCVILKEGVASPNNADKEEGSSYFLANEYVTEEQAVENEEELPTILLAEDHKQLRQFIRDSLGNAYRYIEVEGGVDALKMAVSQVPDLIISDVMMPEMDGLELCKKIKTQDVTSHIPFILLTALADQEDKIVGLENGADDYLTKPFSVNELRIRVRNILRSRRILQELYQTSSLQTLPENLKENAYLQKVEAVIKHNTYDYLFGVERLAELMMLSTGQLNRKIKAITGQPTVVLIQNVRMKMALELLNQGEKNIAEIAYSVGFENAGYFSKVFKKHFGYSPSEKTKLRE